MTCQEFHCDLSGCDRAVDRQRTWPIVASQSVRWKRARSNSHCVDGAEGRAGCVSEGAVAERSAGQRRTSANRENDSPDEVSLAPGYRRRILRLEAMPGNASGADKSWVHRAHADAERHLSSAKRR